MGVPAWISPALGAHARRGQNLAAPLESRRLCLAKQTSGELPESWSCRLSGSGEWVGRFGMSYPCLSSPGGLHTEGAKAGERRIEKTA